jgi:hypothetical protein
MVVLARDASVIKHDLTGLCPPGRVRPVDWYHAATPASDNSVVYHLAVVFALLDKPCLPQGFCSKSDELYSRSFLP